MSIRLNVMLSVLLLLVSFASVTCLKLTEQQQVELHDMILNKIQFTVGKKAGAGYAHIQRFNEKTTNGMIVYAQFIDNLNVAEAQRHCMDLLKRNETFLKLGIAGLETFSVSKPVQVGGKYNEEGLKKLKCFVSRFHFIYDLLLWAKQLKGSKPDELPAPKAQPGEDHQKTLPKKTPETVEEAIKFIDDYFNHSDEHMKRIWEHLSEEGHNVPFEELAEIFEEPFANEKATKEGESELKLPCLNPNANESADRMAKEVLQNGKSVLKGLAVESKTPAKETPGKQTPVRAERTEQRAAKETERSEQSSHNRSIQFLIETETYGHVPESFTIEITAGLCSSHYP